jgi:NADPH:quinone reductase-like Zn-dependent oxidoreductase
VGNSVLRDSLLTVRAGGGVAQLGFLGGQEPVDAFNPFFDLPSGVRLSFFGSFLLGTADFPLSDVPLADLIAKAESGTFRAKPTRVFGFDEVVEAHRLMEANQAAGKLVVSVS